MKDHDSIVISKDEYTIEMRTPESYPELREFFKELAELTVPTREDWQERSSYGELIKFHIAEGIEEGEDLYTLFRKAIAAVAIFSADEAFVEQTMKALKDQGHT